MDVSQGLDRCWACWPNTFVNCNPFFLKSVFISMTSDILPKTGEICSGWPSFNFPQICRLLVSDVCWLPHASRESLWTKFLQESSGLAHFPHGSHLVSMEMNPCLCPFFLSLLHRASPSLSLTGLTLLPLQRVFGNYPEAPLDWLKVSRKSPQSFPLWVEGTSCLQGNPHPLALHFNSF